MRVSYSGYYATLPRSREGFNSPYPLTKQKDHRNMVFLYNKKRYFVSSVHRLAGYYLFTQVLEQASLACLRQADANHHALCGITDFFAVKFNA